MQTVSVSRLSEVVLTFAPVAEELCPNEKGSEDILYYFGAVDCPNCHRRIPVDAPRGVIAHGYCFWSDCGARLEVQVDDSHLRLDDSRPQHSGHGCRCGDALCQEWRRAV